ncbi:MAG: hypothetical protein F6K14_18150 [Symploca sp. SIO2C1]|nr:hypothetical protein [Symploca sp. SIO2C1]
MNEKKGGKTSQQTRRRGDAETRRMKMPPKILLTHRKEDSPSYQLSNFIILLFRLTKLGEMNQDGNMTQIFQRLELH